MPTTISKDGTIIGYDSIGSGPALILVEGATGFRAFGGSKALAELLAPYFTVYYYDRRGRGESGDTKPFAVEREIEDIAALITVAGGTAYVYGISSGAALALEAAAKLPGKITKLALYEAPYDESEAGKAAWRTYTKELAELLPADRRGDAIAAFMKLVGVPEDMLKGMRQSPMWPVLESVAPTLAYDAAALGEERRVPVERARTITVPTLVMEGEASREIMPFMHISAEIITDAVPHAEHQVVKGQSHDVDPKVLAPLLRTFFQKQSTPSK